MRLRLILVLILLAPVVSSRADHFEDYIERFSSLAIEQQQEFGIPASVTLAQGILESSAGRSTLATKGNNHFGIKCHKEWSGETMTRSDDAPNECFRVYHSPEESYRDHSLFLKRDRYKTLFQLEVTDYAGWAVGLKSCGYATDPNYADRLITIIERYSLYNFDTPDGHPIDETAEFIKELLGASHPVRKTHGLHYVVALPGDTYESIAKELGLKTKKLRAFNDATKKTEIKEWEEVYLQEKNEIPPAGVSSATIGEGESMRSIAQRYGMKLSVVKSLNNKAKDRPGTVLKLK